MEVCWSSSISSIVDDLLASSGAMTSLNSYLFVVLSSEKLIDELEEC